MQKESSGLLELSHRCWTQYTEEDRELERGQDLLLQGPVLHPGTVEGTGKGSVRGREYERRCIVRRQLACA